MKMINSTNQSLNGNSSEKTLVCGYDFNSEGAKVSHIVFYCLILVFSLCGNGMVTTIIYRSPRMRNTTNYFIANMAISDLLLPIFVLPNKITQISAGNPELWLVHGDLGSALCKLVVFLHDVSFGVSIQSLVVIAVDRFFAVVFPLRGPAFPKKMCPLVITITWVLAALVHSPYLYALKLVYVDKDAHCWLRWEPAFNNGYEITKQYITVLLIVLFLIPLMAIVGLYSVIAYDLSKRSACEVNYNSKSRQRRDKENRNVIRMLAMVVVAYTVSFTPTCIHVFTQFYAPMGTLSQCTAQLFPIISQLFAYVNGAVNPMIYFIFSENYRHGLKKSVECVLSCCPSISLRSRRHCATLVDEISTTRIQATLELTRLSLDVNTLGINLLEAANGLEYKDLMASRRYSCARSSFSERDEKHSTSIY